MSNLTIIPFLSKPENTQMLKRFARDLNTAQPIPDMPPQTEKVLKEMMVLISSNADKFDKTAVVFIEISGEHFMREVTDASNRWPNVSNVTFAEIFTLAYFLICELEFSQAGSPSPEISAINRFVRGNIERFQGDVKHRLIYATYFMPAYLTKEILRRSDLRGFQNLDTRVGEAKNLLDNWDGRLKEKLELIEALEKRAANLNSTYNFVGLNNGFKNLRESKNIEKRIAVGLLFLLGLSMLLMPTYYIHTLFNDDVWSAKIKDGIVLLGPAMIGLEFILLYFFRVALSNFRSIRAQLLQLDLRMTLCQFHRKLLGLCS